MNRITLAIIFALLGIMLFVPAVRAANSLFELGGEEELGIGSQKTEPLTLSECIIKGNCSVKHIFLLANNITRWILSVAGAIALFMYIIGGLWMIFSGGNSGRIERGKDILIGTTIALVVILTSWLIVSFVLKGLGTSGDYTLTAVTCGKDADCPVGQVCSKQNKCAERCETDIRTNDTENDWACQKPEDCGVTYDTCDGKQNCKIKYCSGGKDNVCCYKK